MCYSINQTHQVMSSSLCIVFRLTAQNTSDLIPELYMPAIT